VTWTRDPMLGMPFSEAMLYYGRADRVERYLSLLARAKMGPGAAGALTDDERKTMGLLRRVLEDDQALRLRSGEQLAKAFLPQSLAPADISAEWWEEAAVDPDTETTAAHGALLTGLLVYPGVRPSAQPPPQGMIVQNSTTAPNDTRTGLQEKVAAWHVPFSVDNPKASDEEAWAAAKTEFKRDKIPRDMIRKLRQPPDGTKRPVGRKGGKTVADLRR
jgi:hypothetical protein